MRLNQTTEKIWTSAVKLDVAIGFRLPASMYVVEAAPGELLLYSPHELDDELEAEIRSLGDVRWILAPNNFHHMFVGDAATRFEDAAVYGSPRAIEKQKDVDFDGCLEDGPPADLPESVVVFEVGGMPLLNESILWMPEDESLVCCDLVLNVQKREGLMTRLMLGFFLDHKDRPTQGKEYRWFFVKDRKRYAESMRDLLSRKFETLVMAHGVDLTEGGNEALREAVSWALEAEPRALTG